MGRPSKPLVLIKGHRTEAEKEIRKKAEESMLTKQPMKEWKPVRDDESAHRHFIRIRKLLRGIDKDDALYEQVINRYCTLLSECEAYEDKTAKLHGLFDDLEDRKDEMEFTAYMKSALDLTKAIQKNDSLLQTKRKMLLDIEKENIMTIASQLRSVPKKAPDEAEEDPMAKLLGMRK